MAKPKKWPPDDFTPPEGWRLGWELIVKRNRDGGPGMLILKNSITGSFEVHKVIDGHIWYVGQYNDLNRAVRIAEEKLQQLEDGMRVQCGVS